MTMGGNREPRPDTPQTAGRDQDQDREPAAGFAVPFVADDRLAAELAVSKAAQDLEDTIRLHEAPGLPFRGGLSAETAIARINRLVALLRSDRRPLSTHTAHQVEMAVFAAARAGRDAADRDGAVLNALAANLAHAATVRGVSLASDLPGSNAIRTGQDDDARLATTIGTLKAETELLVSEVASLEDPRQMERHIARAVPRLRALMHVRAPGPGRHKAIGKALFDELLLLGRTHHLDLVASHLDQLFDAEDHFLTSHGLDAAHHTARYYGDVTAAQLDDDPTNDDEVDGPRPTGAALIEQIMDFYRGSALQQHLALTSITPMLDEPPPPRDVPAFERLLGQLAQLGMNAIVGRLGELFSSAVRAIAANPGAAAAAVGSAARDVGGAVSDGADAVVDGADAVVDRLPGPVARGARAVGRAAGRGAAKVGRGAAKVGHAAWKGARAVGAQFDTAPEVLHQLNTVGRKVLASTGGTTADVVKLLRPDTSEVISKADKGGGSTGSIVPSFVAAMADRVSAYSNSILERLPLLQHELERVPPGALQRMRDELFASRAAVQAALRTELAQGWTTAIAAAVHGIDDDGTAGTDPDIDFGPWRHRAGIVRINLQVVKGRGPFGISTPIPIVTKEARIAGLGPSILAELHKARVPLIDAKMHREIEVTFRDEYSGQDLRAGAVQMAPDGTIEFGANADLFNFARMSRGDIPDGAHGAFAHGVAEASGKADVADAARIVRLLLETSGLHTGNIFHDESKPPKPD